MFKHKFVVPVSQAGHLSIAAMCFVCMYAILTI